MHVFCKRTYANKNVTLFGKIVSLTTDLPLIPYAQNTTVSNYTSNVVSMTEIYIFILTLVGDE